MTPPKSKMTVVKLMGVACPFLSRPVAGLARPRGIADTHRDARRPCNRGQAHIRPRRRGRRRAFPRRPPLAARRRSEEHTSELQSLMRISYAVFCLKKKKQLNDIHIKQTLTITHILYSLLILCKQLYHCNKQSQHLH